MTFKIKTGKGFNNEGEIYTTEVVARKLNGYKVINPEGNITFICFDDINIIDISNEEKNIPIEW